ncbi:hypothetical protein [Jannaschia marina]|nr:hypothetical protein [Jannaschia marina]
MTVLESLVLAGSLGVLTAILRFVVLAWMPDTTIARLFRRTVG